MIIINSLDFKRLFRWVVFISMFLVSHSAVIGGGFHVYPDSIRFLQSNRALSSANKIDPSIPVEMEFRFDNYVYAGKPYAYAIFEVYEKDNSGIGSPKLLGLSAYRLPTPDNPGSGFGKIMFALPSPNCIYEIKYHVIAYVAFEPLMSSLFGVYLDREDVKKTEFYYSDRSNQPWTTSLAKIKTGPLLKVLEREHYLTVYLKDFEKALKEIKDENPPTFQWFVGPETSKLAKNIEFSYRLLGSEDWTIYSSSTQATYDFMRPGNYLFQVKARYTINNEQLESGIAQEALTVNKEIFRISKAESLRNEPPASLSVDLLNAIQNKKGKALLIGIPTYQEVGFFPPISFVTEDIKIMREVLANKHNFVVEPPGDIPVNPTKNDIITKLESFLKKIDEGDRVIVYFSCHGAAEGDEGYIVPYDARSGDKRNTCIRLKYIEDWVNQLMEQRKAKHVLIILDSCHSGLGLLSKSASTSSIMQLALYPGAYMFTAGLTNQVAYADLDKKKSLFTYFLAEGLNGAADYNHDHVITNFELGGYVQNAVSARVSKLPGVPVPVQTPVMGKIRGQGEMLFILR